MHHLEIEGVSKLIHVTLTCRQISLSYIHINISIDTFKRFNGDVCAYLGVVKHSGGEKVDVLFNSELLLSSKID